MRRAARGGQRCVSAWAASVPADRPLPRPTTRTPTASPAPVTTTVVLSGSGPVYRHASAGGCAGAGELFGGVQTAGSGLPSAPRSETTLVTVMSPRPRNEQTVWSPDMEPLDCQSSMPTRRLRSVASTNAHGAGSVGACGLSGPTGARPESTGGAEASGDPVHPASTPAASAATTTAGAAAVTAAAALDTRIRDTSSHRPVRPFPGADPR